ncbi:serine O-acetyltransferase EpsC [Sphingomonas sp. RB3P16]|uniref:serine O-acetyltransferase EpsC n=1 Tax=Parasphingomonas frigoris TaxID=3096163 RepID=UPI002FCB3197
MPHSPMDTAPDLARSERAVSEAALPTVDMVATVAGLRTVRDTWRQRQTGRHSAERFPSQAAVAQIVEHLSAALFPQRIGVYRGSEAELDGFVAGQLHLAFTELQVQIAREFAYWQAEADEPFERDQAATIVRLFATTLPAVRELIDSDVEAAFLGDPAARSVDEILICYPGALAVLHHRLAHELYQLGAPIVARIISEIANARTGIDIHPGATIGPSFFIDHGTGVVIGETAIIGARVQLYQHVTLGARSPLGTTHVQPRGRYARHPIIEDDVVIYAGATILGRVTIGRGATIGGNVWLLEDVAPGSVVAQPTAAILAGEAALNLHEVLRGRPA